jgi:hypothetical protein
MGVGWGRREEEKGPETEGGDEWDVEDELG